MLDAGQDAEVDAEIKAKCGGGDAAPAAAAGGDYPPTGLSANVQKLPEWIQVGCGDQPYNCAEKGATFAPDGITPDEMPDLSKHSNFMAETLVKDPKIYEKL